MNKGLIAIHNACIAKNLPFVTFRLPQQEHTTTYIQTTPGNVFMVLLPDELSFGEKIVKLSNNNILLLKSDSTFERYKAMIQRADVLLTPDSGPMHMASALGTKTVAFFSMKDPGDCGPYMDPAKFIILRSENTAHPERGINAIDVDTVYDACETLLSTK